MDAMRQAKPGYRPDYPSVPQCLAPPVGPEFRPVIAPGDLMAFSGAHLHGSARNRSDRARFSFEIRTVHLEDLALNRAAPNVDNVAHKKLTRIFSHAVRGDTLVIEGSDAAGTQR